MGLVGLLKLEHMDCCQIPVLQKKKNCFFSRDLCYFYENLLHNDIKIYLISNVNKTK